ncbi:uncharacterized protein LOC144743278 isoform X2 [Ciona intestinalis]
MKKAVGTSDHCDSTDLDSSKSMDVSEDMLMQEVPDDITPPPTLSIKAAPTVQATLSGITTSPSTSMTYDEHFKIIHEKLDDLVKNRSEEVQKTPYTDNESTGHFQILGKAQCLHDIEGSCYSFYINDFGGGLIRCMVCFEHLCDTYPRLGHVKEPMLAKKTYRSIEKNAGNTLSTGLEIPEERMKHLVSGNNQTWYSLKSMLIEHASCSSKRNGGLSHHKALIWKKKNSRIRSKITEIVANQLSSALITIKVKAATLHYESMISFLHCCGSDVGNIGHGRNQFNQMLNVFQTHLFLKTKALLSTPLPSTGVFPHFSTASDKSTPCRITNHAVMILVQHKGKKITIPVDAPTVYHLSGDNNLEGGTAANLAEQVFEAICGTSSVKLPQVQLSYLVAHQADGQYQAKQFKTTLTSLIHQKDACSVPADDPQSFFVVAWDTAHWMDCALVAVKNKDCKIFFDRLIRRSNKFNVMFGRGKGAAEYASIKKRYDLPGNVAKTYATTRFTSSAYEQFTSIYGSYEALVRTFEENRETEDDCEQTKYLVKGKDFCIDLCGVLDCLAPVTKVMIRAQSVNQNLWQIIKWWPKLKSILIGMKQNLEEVQQGDVSLDNKLFPKLYIHFAEISKYGRFHNVALEDGWIVCPHAETIINGSVKRKVFEWKMRQPGDCLVDLIHLCEAVHNRLEKRMSKCVPHVSSILAECMYLPDILNLVTGGMHILALNQRAELEDYGNTSFKQFFQYVCSLPHVKEFSEKNPSLNLHPTFAHTVFSRYKKTVFRVIWEDFGHCRHNWFGLDPNASQLLRFDATDRSDFELDEKFRASRYADNSKVLSRLGAKAGSFVLCDEDQPS